MVRVNRVRRIIRKVDPWTVLKVTLVLNFIVSLTLVLGLSILWVLLVNAGVPQGLEDIARRLALLDQDASLVGNIETLFTNRNKKKKRIMESRIDYNLFKALALCYQLDK